MGELATAPSPGHTKVFPSPPQVAAATAGTGTNSTAMIINTGTSRRNGLRLCLLVGGGIKKRDKKVGSDKDVGRGRWWERSGKSWNGEDCVRETGKGRETMRVYFMREMAEG